MGQKWALALLAIPLMAIACGKKTDQGLVRQVTGDHQRGLASWYGQGDGYHGRTTANGERFDKNKLTAAHYSLPFGTRVRVKNLNNGKTVEVRINDRFPIQTLRKGRIIDLSYAAAKALDMVEAGVVPIVLEVIQRP